MKKVSCNATIITEEIEADDFNKLIELNDVYTQDECGGSWKISIQMQFLSQLKSFVMVMEHFKAAFLYWQPSNNKHFKQNMCAVDFWLRKQPYKS